MASARRDGLALLCLATWLGGCAGVALPTWLGGAEPDAEYPPIVAQPASELPAPEGLRARSGEYRSVPLQWDPLLDGEVGGYWIERAEQREGPYLPLEPIWGRGAIARADADLGDGVTRFYRIRAFTRDARLSVTVSDVVVATTASLPAAPEGLRAYSRQPREVPLSWRAAEDPHVASYVVERSPSPDGPFEPIATLEGRHATSHVDRGLGDLRVFYYRVAARNPDGAIGAPSDSVRAVTKPEPLPPLGLRLDSQLLGVNVLAWVPNVERDLAEYRLYQVITEGPARLVTSVSADQSSAQDDLVGAGETVGYTLVAVDRDGLESRPSEPVETVGVRYGLAAEAQDDGVHLSWDPRLEEGFVRARVERDGWFGRRTLGSSETGHFLDPEVVPGRTYRYIAVLEHADATEAPPSRPIAVSVPKATALR